ncbi:MAG: helical backbone metal receptor [Lautropia sp.]|nr:helical backbone metal receptor [Lautropia sp.]
MFLLIFLVALAGTGTGLASAQGQRDEALSLVPTDRAVKDGEGTSSTAAGQRLKDDAGNTVWLARPARRIVSLSPALTESVCVLGGCERLVGVDRFANWPERIGHLPRLDAQGRGSVEAVLALQPDLVLMADGAAERSWRASLQKLGVPVLVLAPERLADVHGVLRRLAQVLGVDEARADEVWAGIGRDLQKLAESLPREARGWRTWLEVDPAPWLAGPDSFMGEILSLLGLRNVLDAAPKPFVQVNREWVFQAAPDLLMIGDHGRGGLAALHARPGWSRLPALRQGRVCPFQGDALDTLARPGPRVAEGARQMLACVQRLTSARGAAQTIGDVGGSDASGGLSSLGGGE